MRNVRIKAKHGVSRLLHAYADLRIGATKAEKLCYKTSDSILLTFDDIGTPQEIGTLLEVLSASRVKAMFFLIGSWSDKHPQMVDKIRAAGHIIGNHTYTHANLLKLSDDAVRNEILRGVPSRWLRAPQGKANRRIRKIANTLGYSLCYWTIDSRDWTGASVAEMRHTILTELRPGAVILFHINGRHTGELLPELISSLRSQGYRLTDLSEDW